VLQLSSLGGEGEAIEGGGSLLYFRILRLARTVRIFRVFRVMRFVRSLRILVQSVLNTLRSLFWTMLLLVLIIYLFAVLFTQATTQYVVAFAVQDRPPKDALLRQCYGSLGRSVYTLFQSISGGVSWHEVVEPLTDVGGVWISLFIVFITFTYFAVLNVVTGVFCQTAIESAHQDQDMVVQAQLMSKQDYTRRLQELFRNIDSCGTGKITFAEFEERLKDDELKAYFASIELSVDEAWNLFKLLDTSESYAIDVEEFVTGCLRLRGSAKSVDIAMLMYQSKWTMRRLTMLMEIVDELRERVLLDPAVPGQPTSEAAILEEEERAAASGSTMAL